MARWAGLHGVRWGTLWAWCELRVDSSVWCYCMSLGFLHWAHLTALPSQGQSAPSGPRLPLPFHSGTLPPPTTLLLDIIFIGFWPAFLLEWQVWSAWNTGPSWLSALCWGQCSLFPLKPSSCTAISVPSLRVSPVGQCQGSGLASQTPRKTGQGPHVVGPFSLWQWGRNTLFAPQCRQGKCHSKNFLWRSLFSFPMLTHFYTLLVGLWLRFGIGLGLLHLWVLTPPTMQQKFSTYFFSWPFRPQWKQESCFNILLSFLKFIFIFLKI